jgi:hypothetical protein
LQAKTKYNKVFKEICPATVSLIRAKINVAKFAGLKANMSYWGVGLTKLIHN